MPLGHLTSRLAGHMPKLKLIAFDDDDLRVVSAHLQDAIVRVGDLVLLPKERRFAAALNRFDWASALTAGQSQQPNARRQTALRFERVLGARRTGFDPGQPEQALVLLTISFERRGEEDPGGTVTLTFAGQAAVQLDVECLEAEMRDLGPRWATKSRPKHPLDESSEA